MAPPHKRRKLSASTSTESLIPEGEVARGWPTPTFSHGLEHLPHAHTVSASRQVPQRIEEVHLQIHQQAVADPDTHLRLHPRQGTAVSSDPTLAVTVVASVDTDGSTTGLSTTINAAAASGISSSSSTATTAVISSPTPSDSNSASSSSEATSTQSGTDTISSTSDNSTESSTVTSSLSSGSGSTASGLIGISPSGGTATSTSTNGSSGSVSLTGTVTSLSTGASLSGSVSQNLTTSALIVKDSSSTYTTRTTIDLDSSTSRSGLQTTHASSQTSSLGAAFFPTTLGDGTVETLARSSQSYLTTFANGDSATVPAATGSYVTATGTDGATSVVYETASAAGSTEQSTITSFATMGGAGQQGTATSSASSSTSSASGGGGNSNNGVAPPGTIAGGVVGGAAGLAVILLIAMLFLRWYRRRSQLGHQALPPNAGVSPDPEQGAEVSRQPGMAERAGLMPALGAVPALFRHQNRSREETGPSDRGFTRVSGRKLPSSFSPGMSTSPPPTMPLADPERNLSTTSFYRDSAGFYGGGAEPTSPTTGVPAGAEREELTLSPGPQRIPTVHTGGPYVMSPTASSPASLRPWTDTPGSPPGTAATAATFDRSDTPSSLDPNRSSRFTEEV